jgi:hypothetical protein
MKWKWFIKTLTGYTCCLANAKGTFTVTHNPFRKPIMKWSDVKINGIKVSCIFFDEADELPEPPQES